MKITGSDIMAALKSGAWVGWLGTIVVAATAFGLLDSQQASEINNIAAGIATVVAAIMATVHTWHAASKIAQIRKLSMKNATGRAA
jgi:hypothetical protein